MLFTQTYVLPGEGTITLSLTTSFEGHTFLSNVKSQQIGEACAQLIRTLEKHGLADPRGYKE